MPVRKAAADPAARLRALCLALPEAHEVAAWGEPTFRVRNKMFATYAAANNHHGAGRPAVWLKAAPGNQPFMVAHAPTRFFVPPYVGPSGWVGVWLDEACDWDELRHLVADAWRLIAPKRLAATLGVDDAPPARAPAKTATKRSTKNAARKSVKEPAKESKARKSAAKKSRASKQTTPRKSSVVGATTKTTAKKRSTRTP